jgi:hypothetical protein
VENVGRIAARRAKVAEFYATKTMPELAELLGVGISTIWRDVHALGLEARPPHTRPKYEPGPTGEACGHCGKPIPHRPPSHGRQRGRVNGQTLGNFCSRECFLAQAKTGVVNTCPMCGKERYRPAAHAHKKCCGYVCSNRYRWRVSMKGIERLVRKYYGGRARQRWLGRLKGGEFGKLGGRPTVQLTDTQLTEAEKLHEQGWGRRAIATRLQVSPHAVHKALYS